VEALPKVGDYSLLIIDANKVGRKAVRRLERVLHTIMTPRLNFQKKGIPKTYTPIDTKSVFGAVIFS
jgi:hypothetical protein